jgi:hypothetical protein
VIETVLFASLLLFSALAVVSCRHVATHFAGGASAAAAAAPAAQPIKAKL